MSVVAATAAKRNICRCTWAGRRCQGLQSNALTRVEIRGDVARPDFIEADGRHDGRGIDSAVLANPLDQVFRRIGKPAGDVNTLGELFQWRADIPIRARYACDAGTGAAAGLLDEASPLPGIAAPQE